MSMYKVKIGSIIHNGKQYKVGAILPRDYKPHPQHLADKTVEKSFDDKVVNTGAVVIDVNTPKPGDVDPLAQPIEQPISAPVEIVDEDEPSIDDSAPDNPETPKKRGHKKAN